MAAGRWNGASRAVARGGGPAAQGHGCRGRGAAGRGRWIGWLLVVTVGACGPPARPSADEERGRAFVDEAGTVLARNVVVVSLDTLRADRLEPYGYGRPTSPNLSAFARRAVVFEKAQAQAPHTAPSHASLLTSTYPSTHGIVNVHGGSTHAPVLPPQVRTVAEELSAVGVETAAFVSGGNLTRTMAMDRGFDVWDESNEDFADRARAFLEWVGAPGRGRFFALLHTYEVHAPYLPPAELVPTFTDPAYQGVLRERLGRYLALSPDQAWAGAVGPDYWEGMLEFGPEDVRFLSDLYDAEIAYTDQVLRSVFAALMTGPSAETTAIVVLSDHGEEFKDHGKYQHDQLFEELVRVPLMIRLPGPLERAGWTGRVSTPVELVDVAPTITALMGVRTPQSWAGRSLVPLMDPEAGALVERPRFSELVLELPSGPKRYRSVTMDGWKYIHVHQEGIDKTWELLFDLEADPGEERNLIGVGDPQARERVEALRGLLDDYLAAASERARGVGRAARVGLSDEERARLEALGYLGGGAAPGGR